MNKILLIILGTLAFIGVSGNTSAAEYNGYFVDIDSNHDEYISWNEFASYFSHGTMEVFDEIDANGDEFIDYDEWQFFKETNDYGNRERYEKEYRDKYGYHYVFLNGYWYKLAHGRRYRITHGYRYHDPSGYQYVFLHGRWFKSGHGYWFRSGGHRHKVIQGFTHSSRHRQVIVKPRKHGRHFGRQSIGTTHIRRHRHHYFSGRGTDHFIVKNRRHLLGKTGRSSIMSKRRSRTQRHSSFAARRHQRHMVRYSGRR